MLPQEVAAGGCRQLGWWEGLGPASTTQLPAHLNSVTHAHTHAYPRTHAARREMDGDSSGGVDFAEFQAWFERLKAAGAMPSWGAVRPAPLSSAVLLLLHPHLLRVDSLLALWISHCGLCGSFSGTRADAVARRCSPVSSWVGAGVGTVASARARGKRASAEGGTGAGASQRGSKHASGAGAVRGGDTQASPSRGGCHPRAAHGGGGARGDCLGAAATTMRTMMITEVLWRSCTAEADWILCLLSADIHRRLICRTPRR
jgi:hypothetical protein